MNMTNVTVLKIAKIILRILLYPVLIIYLIIIVFYIKGIKASHIQNIPVSTEIYQDAIYNSYLMVDSDENARKNINNMEMKSISIVVDLPLCFIKEGHYYEIAQRTQTNVAYYIAKHTLQDFELKKNQGDLMFTTIWITNHWTLKESLNYLLDRFDYGNGYFGIKLASKGYFNKTPNELNPYEILTLQALMKAPQALNPRTNQQALLENVNLLIERAKENYPQRFASLHFLNQLPAMQGIKNSMMSESTLNLEEQNRSIDLNVSSTIRVKYELNARPQETQTIIHKEISQKAQNNSPKVETSDEKVDFSTLPDAQIIHDEPKVEPTKETNTTP